MAKKIDPLNKKQYGAVSAMLTVSDIPTAVSFYQKAFGFSKRTVMNGPDGKPIHAELTLRGTTLMLGPENPALGKRTAKTIGASPASLFLYVEDVDKVVSKALSSGATSKGPVMDMFWGDRCGTIVDPDGYAWMVGTHKAEPTAKQDRLAARSRSICGRGAFECDAHCEPDYAEVCSFGDGIEGHESRDAIPLDRVASGALTLNHI